MRANDLLMQRKQRTRFATAIFDITANCCTAVATALTGSKHDAFNEDIWEGRLVDFATLFLTL